MEYLHRILGKDTLPGWPAHTSCVEMSWRFAGQRGEGYLLYDEHKHCGIEDGW